MTHRFGEVVNISTYTDIKSSVIQYKTEEGAKKAMESPIVPFNLTQIEMFCNNVKADKTKGNDQRQGHPAVSQHQHQQQRPHQPPPKPHHHHGQNRRFQQHQQQPKYMQNRQPGSHSFIKKDGGYKAKATLEEKKRNWKLLQEHKNLILSRLTDFIKLFLVLKRTKKTPEEKGRIQKMIKETNQKMLRANQCKDFSILKSEFPDKSRQPLNITLQIDSKNPLEYSYLSNLLSTYGRLEKLLIDESATTAKIKFFSIEDAFKV